VLDLAAFEPTSVERAVHSCGLVRFGSFEADPRTGELRKAGVKLKLRGQPFQVLAILLERPGEVVTREEIQKRLWPDTFVDADHNLNTAINRIREVLGDSAESPRFVETLPRRGYRFIAPVEDIRPTTAPAEEVTQEAWRKLHISPWALLLFAAILLLTVAGVFVNRWLRIPSPSLAQRTLTRVTFDDGLQIGTTWSPDGRFIAYSSDHGGKFDIWVEQVSGGEPVQITKGAGHNWQPDWSPYGRYIAYRSENGRGGLFVIPALGGPGLERKISSFGYYPCWSPHGAQILFQTGQFAEDNRFYVVSLDGSPPREVLTGFLAKHQFSARSAAWYPDGKRVTVWIRDDSAAPSFWTVPIPDGEGRKLEIDQRIASEFGQVSLGRGFPEFEADLKFSWAPSGRAIYFERTFRGARNLWKMTVDPQTLRALSVERLTTDTGLDTEPALSPDGKSLAFTAESQQVRAWLFPFDANQGRFTGSGRAVTSPAMEAGVHSLTRDGNKLAFVAMRSGKWELWEKSLVDGREAPVMADNYIRNIPQWSPDGTRLAYWRGNSVAYWNGTSWSGGEGQLVVWFGETRGEEALTLPSTLGKWPYSWSPDGKKLLVSQETAGSHRTEVFLRSALPSSDAEARKIISDPAYDIWQPQFSPDGRWIVFEASSAAPKLRISKLYVMPAAGGPWTQITGGNPWEDKPRWSPDGKTIYFVSVRGGFFNVWGIHFDGAKGRPIGEPFRVTAFESPALMIPKYIPHVELSLARNRFVLNLAQVSGGIWVLDNVDQ